MEKSLDAILERAFDAGRYTDKSWQDVKAELSGYTPLEGAMNRHPAGSHLHIPTQREPQPCE